MTKASTFQLTTGITSMPKASGTKTIRIPTGTSTRRIIPIGEIGDQSINMRLNNCPIITTQSVVQAPLEDPPTDKLIRGTPIIMLAELSTPTTLASTTEAQAIIILRAWTH